MASHGKEGRVCRDRRSFVQKLFLCLIIVLYLICLAFPVDIYKELWEILFIVISTKVKKILMRC